MPHDVFLPIKPFMINLVSQIRIWLVAGISSLLLVGTVVAAGLQAPLFVSTAGGVVPANTNGLSHDVTTITVAAAEASANTGQNFVFVGNSQGNIDVVGGGTDGFTLLSGQSLSSFHNGNVITDGSGSAITSDNVVAVNTDPAATRVITTNFGGDNEISNLSILRSCCTTAIAIGNATGSAVMLTNLSIDNGPGTAILLDGNTANVTLLNVDLVDLNMSGPNTGIALSITGASHAGQITVGPGSDLGNTTGTVIAANVTDKILRLDTSAAHIISANNTQNVVDIAGLAAGSMVLLGMITVDGAIGDNVINIENMTGGQVFLQDVLITNFGNQPTDTAIEITGTGVTVDIGQLSGSNTNGNQLTIGYL